MGTDIPVCLVCWQMVGKEMLKYHFPSPDISYRVPIFSVVCYGFCSATPGKPLTVYKSKNRRQMQNVLFSNAKRLENATALKNFLLFLRRQGKLLP